MVGLAEGLSFLVLLFIAMPLKYAAGMPMAVKLVGWAHGGLFVLYILALVQVAGATDWGFRRIATAFLAAVVPFGTFVLDRSLRREEQELAAKEPAPAE